MKKKKAQRSKFSKVSMIFFIVGIGLVYSCTFELPEQNDSSFFNNPKGKFLISSFGDPEFKYVQMKHSHNSYHRTQTLYQQARNLMVRSFEIDLHGQKSGTYVNGNWYVYHTDGDQTTTCTYLTDALNSLKQFHNENPNHEVITVWIEMKEAFSSAYNQTPAVLDNLIKNQISTSNLITPNNILTRGTETYLRDVVRNHGWPTLSQLQGKFMFVILGVDDAYDTSYSNSTSVCFLENENANSIFTNRTLGQYSASDFNDGLVNRLTQAESTSGYTAQQAWTQAIDQNMQFLGTDAVDYTVSDNAWACTNNMYGYPFRSILLDYSTKQENLNYTPFPNGYPNQWYWESRLNSVGNSGKAQWIFDINSDGKCDYVYTMNGTSTYKTMLSDGCMFSAETTVGNRTYGVGYNQLCEWWADLNNDGKKDLVYDRDGTSDVRACINTGGILGTDTYWGTRSYGIINSGKGAWFVDLNADGKADYIYNRESTGEYRVLLSTGSSLGSDVSWGSRSYAIGYNYSAEWFVDMNADNKTDQVYNRDGTREMRVRLSNGSGFGTESIWCTRSYSVGYSGLSQWLVDVNGDGKTDYIYNRDGTKEYRVRLSTGSGFGSEISWGTRNYGVGYAGTAEWFVDINGDGKADQVYNRDATREYYVRYSTGSGFQTEKLLGMRNDPRFAEWFMDVNGDGKKDHISNRDGSNELWTRTTY